MIPKEIQGTQCRWSNRTKNKLDNTNKKTLEKEELSQRPQQLATWLKILIQTFPE